MTSGLNYTLIRPEVTEVIEKSEGRAPTLDICRALAKAPLEFDPGEHFMYSLSHDVMAGVIEAVTGERFSDYVKENVVLPLGRYETEVHPDPDKAFSDAANQLRLSDVENILRQALEIDNIIKKS